MKSNLVKISGLAIALINLGLLVAEPKIEIISYLHFLIYSFIFFSLPIVVSRYLLKKNSTLIAVSMYFLIFIPLYFLFLGLKEISDLRTASFIIVAIASLIWSLIIIFESKLISNDINKNAREIVTLIFVYIALSALLILIIRGLNSVVALDYLQHQTVTNRMFIDAKVCLIPGACSNLFLQNGYTTFYHLLVGFWTIIGGFEQRIAFFMFDFVWIFVGLLTYYFVAGKFLNKKSSALLVSVFATLIYFNGAFEFYIFLPQTLAFFFFMLFISEKLNLGKLIAACILLLITHFVIGMYLAGFLVIKYLVVDNKAFSNSNTFIRLARIISLFILIFTLVLSWTGFSFEDTFQRKELEVIGSFTNPGFSGNALILTNTLGLIILLLLFIYLVTNRSNKFLNYSFVYIALSLSTFFIGITYATKFLIGLNFAIAFILIFFYENYLHRKNSFSLLYLVGIILGLVPNFFFIQLDYVSFYENEKDKYSAITSYDEDFADEIKNTDLNCYIISDPLTQLITASLANLDTARANYLSLDSRAKLISFLELPEDETFEEFLETIDLENKNWCFLYSYRLDESMRLNKKLWIDNIYLYPVKSESNISTSNKVRTFFEDQNIKVEYEDSKFILFGVYEEN